MGKLYWTKDVKELLDKKIDDMTKDLVNDKSITPEQAPMFVQQIRVFRMFADEVIEDMERMDREEDERYAAIKSTEAETDGKNDV